MKYTTRNILVSVQKQLATHFLENGYAIRWQTTGEVVPPDVLDFPTPLGTITLVPEFPADPLNVARSPVLNDGTQPKTGQVLVPAFAVSIPDSPKRVRRAGIGDATFERWLTVHIYGFAYDKFQQRDLKDLLYDWFEIGDVKIQVWDYDTDPVTPDELEAMDVIDADISKLENVESVDAVRYYILATLIVSYFE